MGGNGHHGAVTVVGEHVVGRPDRQPFAVDRIGRVPLEEDARLLPVGGLALDVGLRLGGIEILGEARLRLVRCAVHQLRGEIRIRCDDHERRTVQGVGPSGEDGDPLLAAFDGEVDVGADRPADPVALHLQHLARPCALELVQVIEQSVGVVGDLEVPLGQLLLLDDGPAALARAVDDLLVREHRLVVGAPVDRALTAVRQTALVHLLEQPLVPLVVVGVGCVQPARPVERDAVGVHARDLLLDVLVRPLAGVRPALDGRVLSRQSEGVPPDRMQYVVAAMAPEPGDDVAVEVVLRVPHVQVARRVREHRQHVLPRPQITFVAGAERIVLGPAGLPLRLDGVHGAVLLRGCLVRHCE